MPSRLGWILDALPRDLRYALRALTRDRGFTAVATLVLTGVLFGLAPAPHLSRQDRRAVMNEEGRGPTSISASVVWATWASSSPMPWVPTR
jgi:hypothetical protein